MLYTVLTVPPSPLQCWRGCPPLSGGERTSPAPVPSAAVPQKPETGSCKPELGFTMTLGAQVHCSPQRNFSSHSASGRVAFSSPAL
ncbi:unnamed protein product, partial [Staurois parvus]